METERRGERWRARGMAVSAGVALGLALPGPGIAPLVLLVPGLLRRALEDARGWRALRLGWLAGTAQWLVAVPWITIVLNRYGHSGLPLAVLGWVVLALVLGLTWAVVAWAASRTPLGWRFWLVPLALVAAEVMQSLPPWAFPWNPIATVVTRWPALLTPLPVIGAAGLSLGLLLAGAALDALVSGRARTALGIAVACLLLLGGGAVLAPRFEPAGEPLLVAAVQPDVELEVRWEPENLAAIEQTVWGISAEAAAAGATWIVWPESAVPRMLERDGAYRAAVERFARRHGVWLTLGSIGQGPAEGEYCNSVYMASPGGLLPYRFDKVHLVPFGEYVPLLGRIAFLRPLVREVGAFTPGTSTLPMPSPAGPVGVAVCYEVAFPSLYANEVRQGAAVLATITNDGWYGDSAAPRQHLALAVLRAAESRRFLVRAANTGISAIIDPSGRVVERLEFGAKGFIMSTVVPGRGVTPASAWGGEGRLGILLFFAGAFVFGSRRPLRQPGARPRGTNA